MGFNNIELLSKLTEEEKSKLNQILLEVASEGYSNELTGIYYDDYDEIPVNINTFLSDERYLGNYTNKGKDIYPKWKEELQYIHNPANAISQWAITRFNRNRKNYGYCIQLML